MRIKIIRILCATLLLLYLTSSYGQVRSASGKTFEVNEIQKQNIQILHFRISDEHGSDRIDLIKTTKAPGTLKQRLKIDSHTSHTSRRISCAILLQDSVVVESNMSHPLEQSYEYPDEETDKLQRVVLHHKEQYFTVRMPYQKQARQIRFSSINEHKKKKIIAEFDIID